MKLENVVKALYVVRKQSGGPCRTAYIPPHYDIPAIHMLLSEHGCTAVVDVRIPPDVIYFVSEEGDRPADLDELPEYGGTIDENGHVTWCSADQSRLDPRPNDMFNLSDDLKYLLNESGDQCQMDTDDEDDDEC